MSENGRVFIPEMQPLETDLETLLGAVAFLRRLTNGEENGAIVSSAACSELEIAFARSQGRFWIDPKTACGYVLRPKHWRELAEQALSLWTGRKGLEVAGL